MHIEEIFEKNIYGNKFSGIILDIGASNSDSSIFFAVNGAEKVIALEPFPESYEMGKFNIEINNLGDKIILLPYALSDKDRYSEFYISTSNPNANSLKPTEFIKEHGTTFKEKIKVKTISLKTLIENYKIDRIYLLKMDCEGCEYEIIRNLPIEILNKIDNIILEFHNHPQDIPEILKKAGFKVEYKNSPIGILRAYRY
ncbi:hypothetical protein YN1_7370 [Nanoarchaeota archaeon]